MKGHGHWRRTPAMCGSLSDGLESEGLIELHKALEPRHSGERPTERGPNRQSHDDSPRVTVTVQVLLLRPARFPAQKFSLAISKTSMDKRETSIRNLAKWADDVQGQAVKRGHLFSEENPNPERGMGPTDCKYLPTTRQPEGLPIAPGSGWVKVTQRRPPARERRRPARRRRCPPR